MKMREVVNCHGCLRATRRWEEVRVSTSGRRGLVYKLCAACESSLYETIERAIDEDRAYAIKGAR